MFTCIIFLLKMHHVPNRFMFFIKRKCMIFLISLCFVIQIYHVLNRFIIRCKECLFFPTKRKVLTVEVTSFLAKCMPSGPFLLLRIILCSPNNTCIWGILTCAMRISFACQDFSSENCGSLFWFRIRVKHLEETLVVRLHPQQWWRRR